MANHLRAPLLVAAAVLLSVPARDGLRRCDPAAVASPPSPGLRIVSWNLRNFPGDHDLVRLRDRLTALDPQVLALQEIHDLAPLEALWPGWRWRVSGSGGRHGQHVVIGWDPEVVTLSRPLEHTALTMDGRVRPALSGHLRARQAGGPDFHLIVVHLKATRRGYSTRQQQWPRLAAAASARWSSGPDDDDLLVVGDFNVAGGPGVAPDQERLELSRVLSITGLTEWANPRGCTAYWDGVRRDLWWEPSRLDLVWGAGFAELAPERRQTRPGAHCAQHACEPFRASDHHPDPDFQGLTDHCPVVVDLPWADDDPQDAP